MSKSKGNVIDPWDIFSTFGADALRWYFFSAGQPWTPRRVSEDGIREATRQTLVTLWNVFSFFATYADLDGWEPGPDAPQPTHVLDRWVLSELDDTVAAVTAALEGFDALGGATRLATFVDDLSNWYVRRSRPRFWKASRSGRPRHAAPVPRHGRRAAGALLPVPRRRALHHAHRRAARAPGRLAAARRLARRRPRRRRWPPPVASSRSGAPARTDAKVKVRQPLRRALLLHPGVDLEPDVAREIAVELNVKALEDIDTLSGLMSWTVVPNFQALGPRLGPQVNDVKAALATADGSALQRQLEAEGWIEVAGERLEADEVEVRAAAPRGLRARRGRRVGRRPRPRARRRPAPRGPRPRARPGPQRPPQGHRARRSPTGSTSRSTAPAPGRRRGRRARGLDRRRGPRHLTRRRRHRRGCGTEIAIDDHAVRVSRSAEA